MSSFSPFTLSNVFYCCAGPHNYDRQGGVSSDVFRTIHIVRDASNLLSGTLPNLEVLAHPTPAEPIEERHRKTERWPSAYTYLPDACEPSAAVTLIEIKRSFSYFTTEPQNPVPHRETRHHFGGADVKEFRKRLRKRATVFGQKGLDGLIRCDVCVPLNF